MKDRSLLHLRVLTPDGLIFEKKLLNAVNIPLVDSAKIGIRPGHAPLIAETTQGKVKYRSVQDENEIHLHPGILGIRDNTITIFTAGKVEVTSHDKAEIKITEYERLMKTIVEKISS